MLPELDADVKISSSACPSPVLTRPPPPALPKIGGDNDILLDLYTHRSLRGDTQLDNEDYGDAWRLSDLGEQIFSTTATLHYFSRRPLEPHSAIVCLRRDALCDEKVLEISKFYNIARHLRAPPKSKPVEDDVEELRHFWYGFIGALYLRNGLDVVQKWVSGVIDPHYGPPEIRTGPPSTSSSSPALGHYPPPTQYNGYAAPPPPPPGLAGAHYPPTQYNGHAPPPPPPPPAPTGASSSPVEPSQTQYQTQQPPPFAYTGGPDPNASNLPRYGAPQVQAGPTLPLSLFHETAMKLGHVVSYVPEHEGPAHALRWTVRCFLDGVERGLGVGTNQKLAKADAARQVWVNMGWGRY
ncbi:hypothetical protein BDN72DRAFT_798904 [Pluteus cervinus]|uniref:Uncharacterized protein n=1 Tax=Pluteus cervinus TaxID=181527 RepID=A0ACD3ARA2_9AGAR|nr:hypothetical protein BDN72DRAFT_798904 [Pluteus cervinus]